jgi:hypothetical protein
MCTFSTDGARQHGRQGHTSVVMLTVDDEASVIGTVEDAVMRQRSGRDQEARRLGEVCLEEGEMLLSISEERDWDLAEEGLDDGRFSEMIGHNASYDYRYSIDGGSPSLSVSNLIQRDNESVAIASVQVPLHIPAEMVCWLLRCRCSVAV